MSEIGDYLDYLQHLSQPTTEAAPAAMPVHTTSNDPTMLALRLSELAASGQSLRIRSRLLGEEILIVPDDETAKASTGEGIPVYTVAEMREFLTVASSPDMFRMLHRIRKALGPLDLLEPERDPRPDLPDHDLWSAALAIASAEGDQELFGFLHAIRAAGTEIKGNPGSWTLTLPESEWDAVKQRHIRDQWIQPLWPRITSLFDQAARPGGLKN